MRKRRCAAMLGHRGCNDDAAHNDHISSPEGKRTLPQTHAIKAWYRLFPLPGHNLSREVTWQSLSADESPGVGT